MPSLRTALALTLTAAAAAVAAPAVTAEAAPLPVQNAMDALPTAGLTSALPTQSVSGALADSVAPVRDLKLDPLNNTAVDPLDNAVGSQVADFKPVSTAAVTDPVTQGGSLGTLPLIGTATGLLH
jgi:hypothetical protein